ncbi:putative DNA polymerase theta (helicase domain only) [Leptomonas seymouri]|uniref:Putative DNA polymerase theta (Helicase domain only) n=1 Tax=Leptomonas seymouri TaxID=5684 RepID=A0A0N1I506_LEPSE|nr:putative DNA polymerase theta (helicase domain only) [Leptomonas seymouri]|eukprot:KPI85643.1 putative DNA polymerase theta (helicase domain only) [Leptomonas seymouri]
MRRTLVTTKGFHAPRPSGGHPPAEATASVTATGTPAVRSAERQVAPSAAAVGAAASERTTAKTSSSVRKPASGTASTRRTAPSPAKTSARSSTVSSTLANRGVLSGHFSANHLRRGSRREDTNVDCSLVTPTHPNYVAPRVASRCSEEATASQVDAPSHIFTLAGETECECSPISRKRSRSPSASSVPLGEAMQQQIGSLSPSRACLAEAVSEGGSRPPSYRLSSHVTRVVFYPLPAELTATSPPSPAAPLRLQSESGHDKNGVQSTVAPPYKEALTTSILGEDVSLPASYAPHQQIGAHGGPSSSVASLSTAFHSPVGDEEPALREGRATDDREGDSARRRSAETGTTSSSTAASQPGASFLSALEQQQNALAFMPAALTNVSHTELFTLLHSRVSRAPLAPPAASSSPPPFPSRQQQSQVRAPPSMSPPRVLTFSQDASSQDRSLFQHSPGATPPLPATTPPEMAALQPERHTGSCGTAINARDLGAATPPSKAETEGAPPACASVSPPSAPPRRAAPNTVPPSFPTESPGALTLNSCADGLSLRDVPTAAAAAGLPAADEEPPESDEALQRELAEDLRLSMDVAFTPSGAGNGAPPLLSQSSLLHEEEEEEEGRERGQCYGGGDHPLLSEADQEPRLSTAALPEASIAANTPQSGTVEVSSPGATVGLHSGADIVLAGTPCPPSPHAPASHGVDTPVFDFSEPSLNSGSAGATELSHLPLPQQSPSSWPIHEGPPPYIPIPHTSDKAEMISLAVAAAAAAAAAGSSGGVSRHRTVFSLSSCKTPAADESVAQEPSKAAAAVPPGARPPLTSCRCLDMGGRGHTRGSPISHLGNMGAPPAEVVPAEHVALPALLGVQLPDSESTEGHVEGYLPSKSTWMGATHKASATAPATPHGVNFSSGETAARAEGGGCASAQGFVLYGALPPPSPAEPDALSASLLLSSKQTQAPVDTSPLRVVAAVTAPARPGRTCFTLHSAEQAATAAPRSDSANTRALTAMERDGTTLPLPQSVGCVPPPKGSLPTTSMQEFPSGATCVPAVAPLAPAPHLLDASVPYTVDPHMPIVHTCATVFSAVKPSDLVHRPLDSCASGPSADSIVEVSPCAAQRAEGRAAVDFDTENLLGGSTPPSTSHPDAFSMRNAIALRSLSPLQPTPQPPLTATAASLAANLQSIHHPSRALHNDVEQDSSAPDAIAAAPMYSPPPPPPADSFYDLPLSVGNFYAVRRGVQELYDWQHELLTQPEVRGGHSFIYSLPTSGGKTLVAELSLLRCVLNRRQSCFFVLPFVSLAEEKTLALQPLAVAFGFGVEGHYGSSGRFPLCDAPAIYVCTIEKANALLNHMLEVGRTEEIGAVVVDEIHMVGEPRRGATLELFLSKMLMVGQARQEQRAKASVQAQQHRARERSGRANDAVVSAPTLPEHAEAYFPEEDVEGVAGQPAGQPAGTRQAEPEPPVDPGPLQIIGMSATVPNLRTIAEWLHAACFERDFRPVPLRAYSVVGGLVLRDGQCNERSLSGSSVHQHLMELATEMPEASVLIFCASRQQCLDTAKGIVNHLKAQAVAGQELPSFRSNSLSPGAPQLSAIGVPVPDLRKASAASSVPAQASLAIKSLVADLEALVHHEASLLSGVVLYGVAFHHGGLLAEERELIETAFRRKHIRILCSTSTLAAGVNLPARRVIIKSPYVGRDFLTKSRYLQMCGRAGRAGLDPYGESYLLLSRQDQSRGHALMHASVEPCCSRMLEDDQTLARSLLECVGVGLVSDSNSMRQWSASLLSRHTVGPVDSAWRKYLVAASVEDGGVASTSAKVAPPASFAASACITDAPQTTTTVDESESSRPVPTPAAASPSAPLTSVPMDALESMVRTSLDTLARCGLVSIVRTQSEDAGMRLGGKTNGYDGSSAVDVVCQTAVAEGLDGDLEVRVTPFGSSSVRSCFSVEEALLLREELDELRHTGLILSDDLHLCYFLTPLREVGECDWELLRLMMSRMSDSRQCIASLLGVDPYFIDQQAMGLGGPLQVTEEGRRRLFTAKRFYVALMLADVLAEVPLATVEQRYNVNRGQLQNLMRSASMFSSSITSFCRAMEWYSLEAVLSSFVKRLGFGVKPDLLPLMEIRGMQPARARALWNAGFKKLSSIAAADADDMVSKVKSMNPPDAKSAKFFTKRSALMVIREAHLTLQSQIKEKKGELLELALPDGTTR